MKVLQIVPNLALGGAERFVVDLSNNLARKGVDVVLITFFNSEAKKSFNNDLDASIKHICLNKKVGPSILLPFKLLHILLDEAPDVIHTHLNCVVYSILCWLFVRSKVFVHTVHNDAVKEAGGKIGLFIRRLAFKRYVKPVCISKESMSSFKNLYGKTAPIIYNGREVQSVGKTQEEQIRREIESNKNKATNLSIINLARFCNQKNQICLVEAVNKVNQQKEQIDLFLVGSYDYDSSAKEMYSRVKELVTSNIHILGEKENSQLYLKFCDALCLSSIYEGMPISIIESFANACPVLSTPVGGVVEMIEDGVSGFLSKDISVDAVQEMLIAFCALSASERKQMSYSALQAYSRFGINACTDDYLKIYSTR